MVVLQSSLSQYLTPSFDCSVMKLKAILDSLSLSHIQTTSKLWGKLSKYTQDCIAPNHLFCDILAHFLTVSWLAYSTLLPVSLSCVPLPAVDSQQSSQNSSSLKWSTLLHFSSKLHRTSPIIQNGLMPLIQFGLIFYNSAFDFYGSWVVQVTLQL